MKKALSLVLALTIVLGMSTAAFAAVPTKARIDGMAEPISVGFTGSTDLGRISPQEKHVLYIDLTDDMFSWVDDVPTATPTAITSSQIRDAKLTVKATSNKVVDSVTLNASKSRIEVRFVTELAGVKEVDFDFDVYLLINGRSQKDYSINFVGTLANPVVEVYSDDECIDISDGTVVEAQEAIKAIDLELGCCVTVTARMTKGKNYYGVATYETTAADEAIMKEHPEIEDIITLKTINLNSAATSVKLDDVYRSYYVYDKDGKLLGRGSESLPYSDKYYLATREITVTGSNSEAGNTTSTGSNSTGGTGSTSSSGSTTGSSKGNYTYNPNTGR